VVVVHDEDAAVDESKLDMVYLRSGRETAHRSRRPDRL